MCFILSSLRRGLSLAPLHGVYLLFHSPVLSRNGKYNLFSLIGCFPASKGSWRSCGSEIYIPWCDHCWAGRANQTESPAESLSSTWTLRHTLTALAHTLSPQSGIELSLCVHTYAVQLRMFLWFILTGLFLFRSWSWMDRCWGQNQLQWWTKSRSF